GGPGARVGGQGLGHPLRLQGDEDGVDGGPQVASGVAGPSRLELDVTVLPVVDLRLAVRGVLDGAAREVNHDDVGAVGVEAFRVAPSSSTTNTAAGWPKTAGEVVTFHTRTRAFSRTIALGGPARLVEAARHAAPASSFRTGSSKARPFLSSAVMLYPRPRLEA